MQFLLKFIQLIKGIFTLTVHFIDINDNWRFTHTANSHKFACLRFDAFGRVDYDDSRIVSCERSECIFSKVLVTRSFVFLSMLLYLRQGVI